MEKCQRRIQKNARANRIYKEFRKSIQIEKNEEQILQKIEGEIL